MATAGYQILIAQPNKHAPQLATAWAHVLDETWDYLAAEDECLSALLEHPQQHPGIELHDATISRDSAQHLLISWPEGRIFGSRGELHWLWLDEQRVHLVLVSDNDSNSVPNSYTNPLTLTQINVSNNANEESEENEGNELCKDVVYLWGHYEAETDCWIEDRLPEPMPYPNTWKRDNTIAALCVKRYEHEADGQRPYDSLFVRFVAYTTVQA